MGHRIPGRENNLSQRYGRGNGNWCHVSLRVLPYLLAVLLEILYFGLSFYSAFRSLCENVDTCFWLRYERMDSVGVLVNQLALLLPPKMTGFVAFANFYSVNIPTMTDFELPIQNGSWEETCIIGSFKPERACSGTLLDRESQSIRAKGTQKKFKGNISSTWGNEDVCTMLKEVAELGCYLPVLSLVNFYFSLEITHIRGNGTRDSVVLKE